MKRKKYLLLAISALALLIVAGCGSNSQKTAGSNNTENAVKKIVIKGHNFKGTHKGDGSSKNPDYKYSMYFGVNSGLKMRVYVDLKM